MSFHVRPVPIELTRELRRSVLRPFATLDEVAAAEHPDAYVVGAFDEEGRLVGAGMIIPGAEPEGWRVRGMATAPEARRRGAGSAVLEALVERARAAGAARVWCNARTPAVSLYRRAGFVTVSEEFELPRIGPHYRMELVLAEALRGERRAG